MTKLEFVARQFGKAQNKRYEHYVVTRIWHLLQDLDIKCITQQHVSRPDRKRAMTDLYFPQIGLHVEINEPHHIPRADLDKAREKDIINATTHRFMNVDIGLEFCIEKVNAQIDKIVTFVRNEVEDARAANRFKKWDIEAEQNPQTYILKGDMDASEDVAFRTMADAASCFGRDFSRGLQMSYVYHPAERTKRLWFPKFYENDEWSNQISDDEETITEFSKIPEKFREHIDRCMTEETESRLVFACVRSPLGDVMYRFKGEYKLDRKATNYHNGVIHRRIATRVKTYRT